ncbi:MAG: replication restart helicase PriA [Fusobacteriota bacterium]
MSKDNIIFYSLYVDGIKGKLFTYKGDKYKYKIGNWVLVKFGKKEKIALILKKEEKKEYKYKVKKIDSLIKNQPSIPKHMIKLLLWISEYYLADIKDVIAAAYPKDLKANIYERYSYVKPIIPTNQNETKFLEYMQKKQEITPQTLYKHFGKELVEKFDKMGVIKLNKEIRSNERFLQKNVYDEIASLNIKLTEDQKKVRDTIIKSDKNRFLIKGITGSGKTEVYIELIKEAIKNGKGGMFLVPEISLTPQMVQRFKKEFAKDIAVLHSRLTNKQRADEWYSLNRGQKKFVLGVRSAIYAPVKNLEYIIIDEEHETTYKQDSNPRYNAKYVGIKRAELEDAKIILGSATPSIDIYDYAKKGIFELLELKKRYNSKKLPEVEIVDMKKEKDSNLSEKLLEEISKRLQKREQVLIFLNRKGYSSFVQCKSCGETESCPNCSVTLSYYKYDNELRCSYCDYTKKFENICKSCGSKDLKFYGKGTEKLELKLQEYFREAKILRVDSDTVKTKGSYEKIYNDFLAEKYDILVGTQIISKGFHFPNITLVGIISADATLNFPDFRAGEKTFNLIVQASGRAGRGAEKGEVLIQTYSPDHYVIQNALNYDYDNLYKKEIKMRRELNYPPFGKLINIIVSSENEKKLKIEAQNFYNKIKTDKLTIYGPFEAPLYRIQKRYRFQIFIKGKRKEINNYKFELYDKFSKFKKQDIRVTIDVDPINLL